MSSFTTVASGSFGFPVAYPQRTEMCPTMGLVSFQFNANTLWFYRLNNEKVWDIQIDLDEDDRIGRVCWRPDGKLFAVISEHGKVCLFDNSGKAVIEFHMGDITTCGWKSSTTATKKSRYSTLFDIDVIGSMVKLTRQKLTGQQLSTGLDFLLVGSSGCRTSLILSGAFTVEGYQLPVTEGKIVDIASNEGLTSHYILVKQERALQILRLDTNFVRLYGERLNMISQTCSQMVGLVAGLKESIEKMTVDQKPYADYTRSIIDLLKGEIDENGGDKAFHNDDPVYDLYDLLLTGSLSAPTKTWLTDYLGDRGIKRWIKLGRKYFEGSRKTLFYETIPALQHLLVHLSSLKGLAEYEETGSVLGLSEQDIATSTATSSQILKTCYDTMMALNEEQRNFESVMDWLDSIVQEVTTDEKKNGDIKTKLIIRFLMGISSRSKKKEGLGPVCETLSENLDKIFLRIKEKMKKETDCPVSAVLLKDVEDDATWEVKLYGDYGMLLLASGDQVTLVKFQCDTLTSEAVTLGVRGQPKRVCASLTESSDEIVILASYSEDAKLGVIKIDQGGDEDPLIKGAGVTLKSTSIPSEEAGVATYMAHNSKSRVCCAVDNTKKRYALINY